MLFDTDVLIWLFRGKASAARLVEATPERAISVITYMELPQGARSRQEAKTIKEFLSDFAFHIVPLSENIGHRASIYMEEYGLKVGLCPADALIAATAVEHRVVLCTANHKHYRPIKELEIKAFRA